MVVVCNVFIAFEDTGERVLAGALTVSILSSKPDARSIFLLSVQAICQPYFLARINRGEGKDCVFRKIMAVLHNPQQPRPCLTMTVDCFSPARSLCICIPGWIVESDGEPASRAGIAHLFLLDNQYARRIGAAVVGIRKFRIESRPAASK